MTAAACIGEPVSWLRLEQLVLGELPAPVAPTVKAHLDACEACAACLASIRADQVVLPALPALPAEAPVRVPWWRRRLTWAIAGGLAAAAAALLLFLRVPGRERRNVVSELAGPQIRLKGGDVLVVGLVRERGGATTISPIDFAAGDRFKVIVTCSQATEVWADVMVLQPEKAGAPMVASYPFQPTRVTCGNHVPVPGAFTITGGGPASVCLAVDPEKPPTREPLGRRHEGIGCYQLAGR